MNWIHLDISVLPQNEAQGSVTGANKKKKVC